MKSIDAQRRLVMGTAGLAALAIAVPAFAQSGSGSKKTDAEKSALPPSERLMRNNALTSRVLLIYAASARRLGAGEDLESGVFIQAAEVMRDFVHGYQELVEQADVFPVFKNAGRMVELVALLQFQHEAGRQLTERVLKAARGIANSAQRKELTNALQATVTLYAPGIARENTDLLPTLRSLMTSTDFDALAQTLDKAENEKIGAEGFDKAVKRVEAIEKKLGTHDLSQFMPKT
jgi:hemerythrin-like domain-containing protein